MCFGSRCVNYKENSMNIRSAGRLIVAVAFLAAPFTLSAGAQSAGQDMKGAGHETKNAAVDTGHATKHVAKKTAHGTSRVAHKTAHGTKVVGKDIGHGTKVGAEKTVHGTENLGDKIAGKPAIH